MADKPHSFVLTLSKQGQIQLKATNAKEAAEWVLCLQECLVPASDLQHRSDKDCEEALSGTKTIGTESCKSNYLQRSPEHESGDVNIQTVLENV